MFKKKISINVLIILIMVSMLISCAGADTTPKGTESAGKEITKDSEDKSESEDSDDPSISWEDKNMTAPGELPIVKEPVTLTVGIVANPSVSDWKTNEQTVYIEGTTGINLEFNELPSEEFITKIDLMITAGGADLPDILIGGMPLDSLVKWGQTDLIIPLNGYYEDISHYLDQSFAEGCNMSLEEALIYMTCYDGNIYSLPTLSESYNNQISGNRLLVYQPWLDKLNIDRYSIETTDDYYDMLCKIRDTDLNENGKQDEIPLIASKNTLSNLRRGLMSPFVTCQPRYWTKEDGKVDVVFNRDEWREGIRYIRKLVEEGLIMPESFTQDDKQMTAIQTQDVQVVGGVARVSTTNIPASDPNFTAYTHIMPLGGPNGMREIVRVPSIPGNAMAITSNCEYPEVAFRLGDYLCSEEMTIWGRFGVQDTDWSQPKEGEISPYEDLDLVPYKTVLTINQSLSWAELPNNFWANTGPRIYGEKLFFGQALPNDMPANERDYQYTLAKDYFTAGSFANDDKIVNGLIYNEEESEIINSIYNPAITYVEESWARFILGDLDINSDADWNSYVQELSKMNLDEAIAATQSCLDRMYGN